MSYLVITRAAIVKVSDHQSLRSAWKVYGQQNVVGTYLMDKPLSPAQLRRLPKELRARVVAGVQA
jgi:hypothetical protein